MLRKCHVLSCTFLGYQLYKRPEAVNEVIGFQKYTCTVLPCNSSSGHFENKSVHIYTPLSPNYYPMHTKNSFIISVISIHQNLLSVTFFESGKLGSANTSVLKFSIINSRKNYYSILGLKNRLKLF